MQIISNIIGWVGAVSLLSAYALSSFSILRPADLLYQVLNVIGAFGIVYHALSKKDYPPAVLNIIWGLVAVIAVVNFFL